MNKDECLPVEPEKIRAQHKIKPIPKDQKACSKIIPINNDSLSVSADGCLHTANNSLSGSAYGCVSGSAYDPSLCSIKHPPVENMQTIFKNIDYSYIAFY